VLPLSAQYRMSDSLLRLAVLVERIKWKHNM
jgi:hypothetical protein